MHCFPHFRRSRVAMSGVLALGLYAVGGPPARAADAIEGKLPATALEVLKVLQARDVHHVGVLTFRVKKGDQPESLTLPLGLVMRQRLENALLLMNADLPEPVGVLRDAGAVAFRHKERATYLTAQGRAKLFGYKYPLAWGGREVKADAFLAGTVKIDARDGYTTVSIELIDRKKKQPEKLTDFRVKTERTILTDVCSGFALDTGKVRTAGPEADEEARKSVGAARLDNRLVELDIRYTGESQPIVAHPSLPDAEQVPEPQEGQKVVFGLRNLSDKRVAVVLAVNGLNTLDREDVRQYRADECSKWILDPGGRYEVRGFYVGDNKAEPFAVQSAAESDKEEDLNPNPKLGAVELFVFIEGTAGGEPARASGLRKPLPSSADKDPPQTAKQASDLVKLNGGRNVPTAGYIKAGDAEATSLKSQEFKNPQLQEARVIWYKERGK